MKSNILTLMDTVLFDGRQVRDRVLADESVLPEMYRSTNKLLLAYSDAATLLDGENT